MKSKPTKNQEKMQEGIDKSNKISENIQLINDNLRQGMDNLAEVASDVTVETLNPARFYETYTELVKKKQAIVINEFLESDYEIPDFGASSIFRLSYSLREQYLIGSGNMNQAMNQELLLKEVQTKESDLSTSQNKEKSQD